MGWGKLAGLAVLAAGCSAPSGGKITELAASGLTDTSVVLTWKDGVTGEVRFSVERSEVSDSTGFNQVGTVETNGTSFQDQSIQPLSTYWYRVAAVFLNGARSNSAAVKITTLKAITVPYQPSMLAARAFSENDIELTWVDNSNNETGFELERGDAMAGPFARVATAAADAVKVTDTALTRDKTYFYRLRSVNTAGASAYTLIASAKTYVTNDTLAPTVPMNVVATATSPSTIEITWAASTDDISGIGTYRILQNTIEIGTVPATSLTHTATLLGSGAMYCFQVIAEDVVGNKSAASSPMACATTPTTTTGPNAPSGLTATTVSYMQLNLKWFDAANDERGFYIDRSLTTANGFTRIASVGPVTDGGGFYADDAGLSPSTVYYYRVRAHNDAGVSSLSNEASAATLPMPPAAPTNFDAGSPSANTIRLTWTDNGANEDGYSVDQSTMPDAGFVATQVNANATSFVPQNLSPSTTYYFRIRAFNLGGSSATVGPVSETTLAAPNAPTLADAGAIATTSMTITWQDNSADEVGFRIERALAANGPYTQLLKPDGGSPAVAADTAQYQATGLTAATLYFFRVRAVGDAGFSNPAQCMGRTLP